MGPQHWVNQWALQAARAGVCCHSITCLWGTKAQRASRGHTVLVWRTDWKSGKRQMQIALASVYKVVVRCELVSCTLTATHLFCRTALSLGQYGMGHLLCLQTRWRGGSSESHPEHPDPNPGSPPVSSWGWTNHQGRAWFVWRLTTNWLRRKKKAYFFPFFASSLLPNAASFSTSHHTLGWAYHNQTWTSMLSAAMLDRMTSALQFIFPALPLQLNEMIMSALQQTELNQFSPQAEDTPLCVLEFWHWHNMLEKW